MVTREPAIVGLSLLGDASISPNEKQTELFRMICFVCRRPPWMH